ncbi:protein CREG1 [Diorhabda carinulata]|uniref:protein CREG1 n=1 Tax=Diorhabda carinulata TaxID=1163345 RepID=UPI0025A26B28|nr:protein CREG1 [Diorhabda carinulata]
MFYLPFFIFTHFVCGYDALSVPIVPPQPWKAALMARYVIHMTDWVSIATISTQEAINGFPFVSLKSFSDGTSTNSTGVPYLYMTDLDVTGKDVMKDSRVTIMATLAETNYCENKEFDPQDPRCAKILMSGKLFKIEATSPEYDFGRNSLFEKHPSMKNWPKDHLFYVAKVVPEQIEVLDYFGGLKFVTIEDYFNANITELINLDRHFSRVAIIDIDAN